MHAQKEAITFIQTEMPKEYYMNITDGLNTLNLDQKIRFCTHTYNKYNRHYGIF